MRPRAITVVATALFFSVMLFCNGSTPLRAAEQRAPAAGAEAAAAPASTATLWTASFNDLDGKKQSFEQWKGKVIVVYFWATWCVPCHKEAPHLSKVFEANKDKNLVVVGIGIDNADKVRQFVSEKKLTNQIVYGGTEAIQLGRELGNSLGAIPFTVIIDPAGKIIETIRGDAPAGKIEAILAPLLG